MKRLKKKVSLLLSFIFIMNTCVCANSETVKLNTDFYENDTVITPSALDIVPSGISLYVSQDESDVLDDITISTNYVLNSDESYNNINFNGGTLNLNGYTLTVYGDLQQNGGTLDVNGGNLCIVGNYNIGTASKSPTTYLKMTNSNDYVFVGGNFLTNSCASHEGYLTDGFLEIQGDFMQKSSYVYASNRNFYATGNHTTLFSGSDVQTISFEDTKYSKFNKLESTNPNTDCITDAGASIISGENSVFDTLKISSDCKVISDFTANNFVVDYGTFDINEHNVLVNVDTTVTNGTLYINNGNIKTYNDFFIGTENTSTDGYLKMNDKDDYVYVGRNFLTNARSSHDGYLINGLLEIKGNFEQKSSYVYTSTKNFYATNNHKILFSGNSEQTISFEDSGSSKINRIETTNPLVTCSTNVGVGIIEGDSTQFKKLQLCQDSKVSDDFTTEEFILNGGNFNLNGNTLTVTGNAEINKGVFNVNKGVFNVLNNLGLSSTGSSQSGYLKMVNPEDYVYVGNDFTDNSHVSHDGYLTNGLLEIKGNFVQKTTHVYASSKNFYASEEHKTILSGENVQTVSFEDHNSSKFNVLILTKDKDTGYIFIPDKELWNVLTTVTEDITPPSVPTDLTLVSKTSNTVRLKWNAPEDNDVLGYKIYRNGTYIGTSYTTSYTDRNIPSYGEYTYQVMAFDVSKLESEKSEILAVNVEEDGNIPIVNSITPTPGSILKANPTFRISLSDDEALSSVEFYYGSTATDDWTLIESRPLVQQDTVSVFLWETDQLSDGYYDFRVMAYDNAGNVTSQYYRNYNLQTQPPVSAELNGEPGNMTAELSWTNSDENIDYYKLYRSTEENGTYKYLKKVTDTVYTDKNLSADTTYYYYIVSVNKYGNSSTSNKVSVTPNFVDVVAPKANAGFDVSAVVNEPVAFIGEYSTDNVAIASYLWDFGDGTTST